MHPLIRRPALLLPLLLALLGPLPRPACSQVTVGYSNPIFSSATRGRIDQQGLRSTRRFEVAGINAQPIDGSLIYDESTVWSLVDPSNPSSLTVLNLDPQVELRQRATVRNDARVQRTESVFANVNGPLTTTQPFNPRNAVRAQELGLPAQLLTVFPDLEPEPEPAAPSDN